jgi:hypothetical protein
MAFTPRLAQRRAQALLRTLDARPCPDSVPELLQRFELRFPAEPLTR